MNPTPLHNIPRYNLCNIYASLFIASNQNQPQIMSINQTQYIIYQKLGNIEVKVQSCSTVLLCRMHIMML